MCCESMPNIDRSSVGFPLRGTCRTARCFTTMSRDPESAELTASPIPPVEIKQHQTVILMDKSDAVHFRSSASLVHAFSCLCGGIIQNETTQECIPVGCIPLARYRTGGLCPGVSLTETTLVIILNTISKRQDGLGFIGKNGYIFHDSSRCIEVPIGGAYAHMFEDLLQVISYNIPLFSLIQMLKFVLHILNLK